MLFKDYEYDDTGLCLSEEPWRYILIFFYDSINETFKLLAFNL